jgi:hypothetical protein
MDVRPPRLQQTHEPGKRVASPARSEIDSLNAGRNPFPRPAVGARSAKLNIFIHPDKSVGEVDERALRAAGVEIRKKAQDPHVAISLSPAHIRRPSRQVNKPVDQAGLHPTWVGFVM